MRRTGAHALRASHMVPRAPTVDQYAVTGTAKNEMYVTHSCVWSTEKSIIHATLLGSPPLSGSLNTQIDLRHVLSQVVGSTIIHSSVLHVELLHLPFQAVEEHPGSESC
jgi:hypothetical protein